jgi:septum formation protein
VKTGELILASTSPYRRALLDRLGIPYRAVAPDVDEEAFKRLGFGPRKLARRLAIAKAQSVSRAYPDAIVIGSDQVVTIDGECLGKPGTEAQAIAQLSSMQGRTHRIITAMSVCRGVLTKTHVDVARLTMRKLTPDEIARYVRADQPLDCAGSYKLESHGITLFKKIESADQTAIIGLPMMALTTILRQANFNIP